MAEKIHLHLINVNENDVPVLAPVTESFTINEGGNVKPAIILVLIIMVPQG